MAMMFCIIDLALCFFSFLWYCLSWEEQIRCIAVISGDKGGKLVILHGVFCGAPHFQQHQRRSCALHVQRQVQIMKGCLFLVVYC
eukprot:6840318-Ditylum_brightwellii.AAC.1